MRLPVAFAIRGSSAGCCSWQDQGAGGEPGWRAIRVSLERAAAAA